MNRPLRRVAFGVLVLLGLLLVNLTYVQAFWAGELNKRPDNSRVQSRAYEQQRGEILVGGRAVASSVATDDRLKYLRRYSDGPLYAFATGFDSLQFGKEGIEKAEDPVLSGDDSRFALSRAFDFSNDVRRGGSVRLTLNAAAQKAAVDGLDGRRGAVVALDPSTGAILALVSSPSYDPNQLSSHDVAAMTKARQKLLDDPDKPLANRAMREIYPPGSTFKLVTAAAALADGKEPDSEIPGPARLKLPQSTKVLPNENGRQCSPGSDTTTLQTALERSCNTSFGSLGLELGDQALRDQAEKFGFGQQLDVPIPDVPSVFPTDPSPANTAQAAIGQFDVAATPLQMAMVAAGIANRGIVMKPYLVQEELGPDLSRLSRADPEELDRAMSSSAATKLTDMMVSVVENGTGSNGRIPGVRVAGKTGTAQDGDRPPHAWFVSFAPADSGEEAKVAVAVVVLNGGDQTEISGNRLAAPIAKAVMQAVLK